MDKGYSLEKVEDYKKKLTVYLRKNPTATYIQIKTDTKIKIERLYSGGIKEAFKEANVPLHGYLLRRNKKQQKLDVLEFIKSNPGCTVVEIYSVCKVWPARIFGSIEKAYELAGEKYPKRTVPSTVNKEIRKRAYAFEDKVIKRLNLLGETVKYFRTNNGVADVLLKTGPKRYIIEIKDYRSKNNITMSEIKQLNRYIEGTEKCCDGFIVTNPGSKGKRSKLYIDGNEISIITFDEILFKGP